MSTDSESEKGPAEPWLVPATEFARLLHVSTRTLWRLQSLGNLPKPIRIGKSIRWNIQVIRNWIENGCPSVN
ncbi:MAG: helix-turn-helix transcriptional regulator [Pirellula sp.]|nr:helix-turn-helix domain-containing protein [Pirellula sp.]